jgi:hypothetical protein
MEKLNPLIEHCYVSLLDEIWVYAKILPIKEVSFVDKWNFDDSAFM